VTHNTGVFKYQEKQGDDMSEKSDEYYGIVDLPINPTTVSIGTINVPEKVCLDTLVIGPNASIYLAGLEFVILIDGQPVWDGSVPETGRQISIPTDISFSEEKRLLMIIVNPTELIPPAGFETSNILVAIKGDKGECPLKIDIPEYPDDYDEDSALEGHFLFDSDFQSQWT